MKRQILGKNIYVNDEVKGLVTGVYLSKKYPFIKQLSCRLLTGEEFCISALGVVLDNKGVRFDKLRASIPGDYIKLTKGAPIYDEKGVFLDALQNVEIKDGLLLSFVGQKEKRYPYSAAKAVCDAVILGKKPLFPLGEPLPAPLKQKNSSPFVKKSTLISALKKGELIKLTLSLSPFDLSV